MIKFYHVDKFYERSWQALFDISLQIERGEFVFISGRSGAGKTTLLKLVYLDERADSGQIFVNNREYSKIRPKNIPEIRREIGVVFQDFKLLKYKTVFENLEYVTQMTNIPTALAKRKIYDTLHKVGLLSKMNNYPYQLSGGEQQRVAIARAIVNSPEIILADEPTGNLDPVMAKGIIRLLQSMNNLGSTVLMATHNTYLINEYNYRTIVLDQGRINKEY